MTQCEKVLEYIKTHGSITAKEAYFNLGIMRLASRISDLKRAGYLIRSEDIQVENRDGSKSWVSKYSFLKKEEVTNG